MARGHAQEIVYDVTAGTVRLANDAWLTYGGNDLKCPQIFYDIRQQAARCPKQPGAEPGSGQVRFTIPANKTHSKEDAKPAEGKTDAPPAPSGSASPAPTPAPKAP
jgi:lipopolysaccharide export system protein LptA